MPVELSNTIWLKLVADETTPGWLTEYAGTRLLLTEQQAAAFPPHGKGDFFTVLGATIYGYVRDAVDGNGYEWVMQPTPEPIVVAVTAIPGAQGWANTDAGEMYMQIGRTLLARGNSIAEVVWALQQLYSAAVTDYAAQPVPE